ncbi:hypothetical protein ACR9YC_10325 [Parasphingorhabdus sp. DH2-15]|uniref:hypothetical protein n=1 Tax=Parasphingorhabdus sp. DH2-15 TaxID=3444112 RepID=UPI003F6860CF
MMTIFNGAYITGLFDDHNNCQSTSIATNMGQSDFTDYIFWSVHVDPSGNLHYNNEQLCMNGTPVAATVSCLKAVVTAGKAASLERVWLSIGAGGTSDFSNIDTILKTGGATLSNLLSNFTAIAAALDIYGFDYDNEDQIGNVGVITGLTQALYNTNNNYRFSFCPYGSSSFVSPYWIACLEGIYKNLSTQPVIGFNLQCYSGGAGSDPKGWVAAVNNAGTAKTGIRDANALIRPGLAVQGSASGPAYSPAQMTSEFKGYGSVGGWIWNTANVASNGNNPSLSDYAAAITVGT